MNPALQGVNAHLRVQVRRYTDGDRMDRPAVQHCRVVVENATAGVCARLIRRCLSSAQAGRFAIASPK
jgi:hypothetical protein